MRNTKHTYTIERLREVVKESYSYAECLRKLDLPVHGNLYTTLKNRIKTNDIDVSHFKGKSWATGLKFGNKPKIKLEDILNNTKPYNSSAKLRTRLIDEGYFEPKCYNCNNREWMGKPIPLQLEHKNGDHYDNRLENLTILCPNCHCQTPTHGGKNVKLKRIRNGVCTSIEREQKFKKTLRENNKKQYGVTKVRPTKFDISKEELEYLIWNKPVTMIALEFGVSDKAIEKRCKNLGISKPPRGYWSKKKASNC